MKIPEYTIETDGRVVWVNGTHGLLGRFSRTGIDVHVDGRCKGDSCVSEVCSLKHWRDFQKKMLQHHKIEVPDKYLPDYLRKSLDESIDRVRHCLTKIADSTPCPDPGYGGCMGGFLPGIGCQNEAARAALRAFEELVEWSRKA